MYTFHSRVRYTEINHFQGIMSPSAIINYFQDCSTFQSEDMNRGLDFLEARHKVWLLNSWQLELLHPIRLGDEIEIGTWPYAFHGFYGYRNFLMRDENQKDLAVANSIWVYLDTETGKPVRIPADCNGYKIEPPYLMNEIQRKLDIPDGCITHTPIPVIKSNIDSYHHVNNGQYIKIAEEYLPDHFMISSMKVEYRMQAVLGDHLLPMTFAGDNLYTVVLADMQQKPYAIVEFHGSYDETTDQKG